MLLMVIENFQEGTLERIGERIREKGRMLPPDVSYQASWVDADGSRCWQIMEAPDQKSLEPWVAAWADLVDFEVVLVETSAEFWAMRGKES